MHDVRMANNDRPADSVRLHINLHVTVMAMFKRLAAKRSMNLTDTVRRAGMVLDKLEEIEDTPNQYIAVVTKDPKTGEPISMHELFLVIG